MVSQDPRKTSQLANQKIITKAQTAGDLPQLQGLMFSVRLKQVVVIKCNVATRWQKNMWLIIGTQAQVYYFLKLPVFDLHEDLSCQS